MNIGGRTQAAMAKKKRHSKVEIATKLAQANGLATQGKLQSDIARTLGVSVMTLHRWRKAPPGPQLQGDRRWRAGAGHCARDLRGEVGGPPPALPLGIRPEDPAPETTARAEAKARPSLGRRCGDGILFRSFRRRRDCRRAAQGKKEDGHDHVGDRNGGSDSQSTDSPCMKPKKVSTAP